MSTSTRSSKNEGSLQAALPRGTRTVTTAGPGDATRLAREAEAALGIRCIPLFWNHSDDHDLAEIDALEPATELAEAVEDLKVARDYIRLFTGK